MSAALLEFVIPDTDQSMRKIALSKIEELLSQGWTIAAVFSHIITIDKYGRTTTETVYVLQLKS